MSDALIINDRDAIPCAELSLRFSRSSGPGGQGVNTTDSRVESRLVDGTVTVTSSEQRSQLQNRQSAERRLVDLLTEAFAPPAPPRRKTKPSRSSVDKRIKSKKRRGETKRLRRNTDD
ncbi:MAG: aminoacyl-tRNA hydrolase [Solirubrobacterales bacterium]|nr:aminoacyl-tRNA hydrolase [Solirubrobacterales bacterium]